MLMFTIYYLVILLQVNDWISVCLLLITSLAKHKFILFYNFWISTVQPQLRFCGGSWEGFVPPWQCHIVALQTKQKDDWQRVNACAVRTAFKYVAYCQYVNVLMHMSVRPSVCPSHRQQAGRYGALRSDAYWRRRSVAQAAAFPIMRSL